MGPGLGVLVHREEGTNWAAYVRYSDTNLISTLTNTEKRTGQNGNIHTQEHHSATKRGEALTLATTWTDPETTMLSERSRTQKDTQCVIPLTGNVQNRPIRRHRAWVPGCQGLGEGGGVTAYGDRVSFGVMEFSGIRQKSWLHHTVNGLENTELHTLNG